MKKIAIPIENGLLCSHFGHCRQFVIIATDESEILTEEIIDAPPHEPGLLPKWLAEKGVNEIIAGGIGQRAISLFKQQHINVNVGAHSETPKELVQDLLQGKLKTGLNACDH